MDFGCKIDYPFIKENLMNIVFKCVYHCYNNFCDGTCIGIGSLELCHAMERYSQSEWNLVVEQVPDLTKEKASSEVTQSGGLIQQIIREAAVEKKK
jgi:hypothetical protein